MQVAKCALLAITLSTIGFSSVVSSEQRQLDNSVLSFARSNCLFWYFKSQGYDTTDIRKISSGIVEMSTYSADKYQDLAMLVKEYSPEISTKQNLDLQLGKCFVLDVDKSFLDSANKIFAKDER
ncbi:hypothetical protein [Agarivorans sp. Alg241-V36]|uniref:hypothetical protein n=1 Tax=Agarivorans sp. Alg241-V36 TaxID=2305992 RepID=UPI0013CF7B46|nr:hypothetical protein [Agarivorans sp. Alg241-V36]